MRSCGLRYKLVLLRSQSRVGAMIRPCLLRNLMAVRKADALENEKSDKMSDLWLGC